MPSGPEDRARENIDAMLYAAGWIVQDSDKANLAAGRGIALREFSLKKGHGRADYLLYVDKKAIGVIEAKPEGMTLSGTEPQSDKYATGMPESLPAWRRPLPFIYQSTGVETRFTNYMDPDPRSRGVFHFHKPETLTEWASGDNTLRGRLKSMPELDTSGLWDAQITAITNLELSLADNRPRSLIQMATGTGKTFTMVSSIYRLLKHGKAKRVLFLVDRNNLGKQAKGEFDKYVTPDDGRKFKDIYNVQRLESNAIGEVNKVVITTVQRLFSILKGESSFEGELEEDSLYESGAAEVKEAMPVEYNTAVPPEMFDIIVVDECHRSIYNVWRQVLEYFDAFIIGLTATPSKQTFGFFHKNLIMEYPHERAVTDGVNVDFDVYRIRTKISEGGATVEAGQFIGKRDREKREDRWERLDEDFSYERRQLDRDVIAKDQIRTVIRTFKEKLHTEIFPGRTEIPKTLIFAKNDSHAEDIIDAVREEFCKGNEFAQKITYRTTGIKVEDLISQFRNRYNPRIAVTVDMVATGTDFRALEIVLFMRTVRSRTYFEQMKGRAARIIDPDELKGITPDASAKTRFVIVDSVGVVESAVNESRPLERKPSASLKALFDHVKYGGTDPEVVSSIASRLARFERRLSQEDQQALADIAGGQGLGAISGAIVNALDPDVQEEEARREHDTVTSTKEERAVTVDRLIREAVEPLLNNELRERIINLKTAYEQVIDEVTTDVVIEAGYSTEARELAEVMTASFEQFIEENRDDIDALQVLYSRPYSKRITFKEVKELVKLMNSQPPYYWTTEKLWWAYNTLRPEKVHDLHTHELKANIVPLVRFAAGQEQELVPFDECVRERFQVWLDVQTAEGRTFTEEQLEWLRLIAQHIETSLAIDDEDFEYAPFAQMGGITKATKVFGKDLGTILTELNEALTA